MTAQQSNLTQAGYDLVVATTQDAINATMEEYLYSVQYPETVQAYTWDAADRKPVLADYTSLVNAAGVDPFSIPDGTDGSDARVQALYKQLFMCAFRAKIGLPTGMTTYPDIVTLDQGNSSVTYHMYFAEFEILSLTDSFGTVTWTHLTQPPGNPWMFQFTVSLDMRIADQSAFTKLPPNVQAEVKNLNPNSAFSVQQLYLDLNTAGLQTMPAITNLPPQSTAYILLSSTFLNTYWLSLKNNGSNGDGVVLGYSVRPVAPNLQAPSIIPTDLTIEVSPNIDALQHPTGLYGVYTLDYLVMSQNDVLPPAVPFTWNWIESNEEMNAQGVVAVRRDVFVSFLRQLLVPEVQALCYDTSVRVWFTDGGTKFSASYNFGAAATPATISLPANYAPDPTGFTTVLTFGYSSVHSSNDVLDLHAGSVWGDFNYTLTGSVAFKDNMIRFLVNGIAYFNFSEYAFGVNVGYLTGNFVKTTNSVTYQINVDANGDLVATMGQPQITDSPDDMDVTTWDKTMLSGPVQVMQEMQSAVTAALHAAMQNFDNDLLQILNSSHAWVFPGGKTFVFKDAMFSSALDLVTHVTYADPGNGR